MREYTPEQPALFINPHYRSCSGSDSREAVSPATLERVGRYALAGAGDIATAVDAANTAHLAWKGRDAKSRAALLHRVADRLERCDQRGVARLMTEQMGKPYPEAIGEIANCAAVFRYYAEMARDDGGKVAGSTQAGSFQYARYAPYGVSVHIMPYNFPLLIMCWTVAASLAAGNACVVKPAEATTLCTLAFMRCFQDLPDGLVSCLPGGADTARLLIRSPDTHVVAFTGSVAAAREVGQDCAALMKPCIIEAGGSDPMIISAHAPLEVAVAGSVTAAFHLSGQICTSAERFFVVDAIHDEFIAAFAAQTRRLRIGNGLETAEIGPLVSAAARDKVARLVETSIAQGAQAVCGARVPPGMEVGWFYEPTILTGVAPDMPIMHEECFGPVAAVCRVASFEEAIQRANDTSFGLGASVFTSDLAEAMDAAERLQAGMVWVNNPLIDNDALPFGGWKHSGIGRELGRQGLDAFRQAKMVVIDHHPAVQDWWYPYPDDWFYTGGGRPL